MQLSIIVIVSFHLISAIVYIAFIQSGKSYLRTEHATIIFLLPFFGALAALSIEYLNWSEKQGKKQIELQPLSLGNDILWKTLKNFQEKGDIVPLGEAILINDVKIRRKLMLDTIHDDPMKFMDVLLIARHNDDLETSHYATTTIAHSQQRYHIQLQKISVASERDPENMDLLDEYINKLEGYINSGLLEKYLLRNQRIRLLKALDKKLAIKNDDKSALVKKIRTCIELKEYASAVAISEILKLNWPEDEQTWIETIRVCMEGNDREMLMDTIREIQQSQINWTKLGKEQLGSWLKGIV